VQVQQVRRRRVHAARAESAASSLSWMPPKLPLLMHTTWSPGCGHHAPRRRPARRPCRPPRRSDPRAPRRRVHSIRSRPAGRRSRSARFQRPGQLGLHRAQLHGVRTRLEHGQDARLGLADRGTGRVCGASLPAWRASPSGGAQSRRTRARRRFRHAVRGGGARSANDAKARAAWSGATPTCSAAAMAARALSWLCSPSSVHSTRRCAWRPATRRRRAARRARAGAGLFPPGAETQHLAPAASLQHTLKRLVACIHHQASAGRYRAHQVVELGLDGGQVRKDVGVVEFQVVQDGRARPVVHELAALVEECGVVLVGLDHEVGPLPKRAETPKFMRHAADQEAGLQAGLVQDPGQHRGGGCLAVRARHCQHVSALQHMVGQPLRAAGVAGAGIEDGFEQRVAALDDVADDELVGCQRQLVGDQPSTRSMPSARSWLLIGG
jgi:hypothetical protein